MVVSWYSTIFLNYNETHRNTMIYRKHIKELKEILTKNNKLNTVNEVLLSTLNDAIITYNQANKDIQNNGYIVESYNQKYISPSYKIRTQSLKDIHKILGYFAIELKEDFSNEEMEDFIQQLVS